MAGDYLFEHPWGLASQEVYAIIGNPDDASQVRDVVANEWDNLSVDTLDRWVVEMTPHAQNARLHVLTLPGDLSTTRAYPVRIKHRLTPATNAEADPLLASGMVRFEAVTVATNNDKTGYALSSSGLDAVLVEASISAGAGLTNDTGTQLTGINARQALALCAAALEGVLAGAAGTTITIKPAGKPSGNTRITATVDSDGNRTALTLKVPD